MDISLIAALDKNHAIGHDNQLPWHLPADLKRFKALTMGKPLIMGRKTYESIGRPLPGRKSIVITSAKNNTPAQVLKASSFEEALELAKPAQEVFIIGGTQVFEIALPIAHKLYLTWIDGEFEADTFFPKLNLQDFRLISSERHPASSSNPIAFTFCDYLRI